MHMIGHNHPGMKLVPARVEMEQGILNEFTDRRLGQNAGTMTAIERPLDPFASFLISFVAGECSKFLFPSQKQ